MTAEECVLLAVALDFETGFSQPPLLYEQIRQVGVLEDRDMNIVRILIVSAHVQLSKQKLQQRI